MQINMDVAPPTGPVSFCRDHPNESNVPDSIRGYAGNLDPRGYPWACRQGAPVIAYLDGSTIPVHTRGYAIGAWEEVPDFRPQATAQSWIVIVNSLPRAEGKTRQDAEREANDVALYDGHTLLSDDYKSLRPGYWVVYSGQFRSEAEAQWHANHLHKQGWPTAYPRLLER
jgi:hypothetical protein